MIVSRRIFLRMRNILDKAIEKIKTHINMFIDFVLKNRTVYEMTWKNIVELDEPKMTIWCMCFACCIPKATNTHSQYVILMLFSTATMVARTCLVFTLYVHCRSCFFFSFLFTYLISFCYLQSAMWLIF